MSPDELRREANRLRVLADFCARRGEENNRSACLIGAESHDRLADVIEVYEAWCARTEGNDVDEGVELFLADVSMAIHGESSKPCGCYQCIQHEIRDKPFPHNTVQFMAICESCGNKRCPHAEHHDNPCTGSNAPGQPGAVRYPDASRDSRPLSKEEFFARMDEITGHVTARGESDEREER